MAPNSPTLRDRSRRRSHQRLRPRQPESPRLVRAGERRLHDRLEGQARRHDGLHGLAGEDGLRGGVGGVESARGGFEVRLSRGRADEGYGCVGGGGDGSCGGVRGAFLDFCGVVVALACVVGVVGS